MFPYYVNVSVFIRALCLCVLVCFFLLHLFAIQFYCLLRPVHIKNSLQPFSEKSNWGEVPCCWLFGKKKLKAEDFKLKLKDFIMQRQFACAPYLSIYTRLTFKLSCLIVSVATFGLFFSQLITLYQYTPRLMSIKPNLFKCVFHQFSQVRTIICSSTKLSVLASSIYKGVDWLGCLSNLGKVCSMLKH